MIIGKVGYKDILAEEFESGFLEFTAHHKEIEDREKAKFIVISQIVNSKLLLIEAEKVNIKVKKEEIDSEFAKLIFSFNNDLEKFNKVKEELKLDDNIIRERIENNLKIEKYIDYYIKEKGVLINENEIIDFYNKNKSKFVYENREVSFEEIFPYLKEELQKQKSNKIIDERLQYLAKNTKIEINTEWYHNF